MSKLYAYLLAFGGALLGLFTLFHKGKSEGKKEVKQEQLQESLKNVQKVKEITDSNNRLGDDDIRDKLRNKLERK